MSVTAMAAAGLGPLAAQQAEDDRQVRVAMLSFAHVHANGYADQVNGNDRTSISVVWDEVPERGRERADAYSVPFEEDLEAAVSREDVDAVVVNAPTNIHQDVYYAAVAEKKHIFTEKALTIETADSEAVVKAVEESRIKFMISLPSRCSSEVLFLRRVVDEGLLGDITFIRSRIAHSAALDGWFRGHSSWFADPVAAGGGGLFDLGCHTVDVTRWLGGPPRSVIARMNSFTGKYPDVDDNAVAVVEFESGALGSMECAWVQRGGPNPIEVYGTEGYAAIRTTEGEPILQSRKVANDALKDGKHPTVLPPPLPNPMEQWIAAILDGAEMTITVRDGRDLTELLDGCYRSQAEGRAIEFPLT